MPYMLRKRTLPKGFWRGASSTKKRAVRRAVSRMRPTTRKAIATIAKTVVRRETEDKFSGGIVEGPGNPHGPQINSLDIFPILPPIATGTAYNQRTGDKVRPKYITVTVRACLNDNADMVTPYHVDFYILNCKRVKSYNLPGGLGANVPLNQLLDGGNGTNSQYDGSTMAALMPVNKEMFQVLKHWRFKLSTTTSENHKPMSSIQRTFRIKCPATLSYDGPAATYPENFAPFSIVGWSRDDGLPANVGDTHVNITSWSIVHYEDA